MEEEARRPELEYPEVGCGGAESESELEQLNRRWEALSARITAHLRTLEER